MIIITSDTLEEHKVIRDIINKGLQYIPSTIEDKGSLKQLEVFYKINEKDKDTNG